MADQGCRIEILLQRKSTDSLDLIANLQRIVWLHIKFRTS
jgi:hypothetical protein